MGSTNTGNLDAVNNPMSASRSHLLIVDDEPGNIRILSNILAEDYELSAATDGQQALELAAGFAALAHSHPDEFQ